MSKIYNTILLCLRVYAYYGYAYQKLINLFEGITPVNGLFSIKPRKFAIIIFFFFYHDVYAYNNLFRICFIRLLLNRNTVSK